MESKKYDATYRLGNSIVHVVAPAPMTEEEVQKIVRESEQVAWDIWTTFPREKQIQINKEAIARYGKEGREGKDETG